MKQITVKNLLDDGADNNFIKWIVGNYLGDVHKPVASTDNLVRLIYHDRPKEAGSDVRWLAKHGYLSETVDIGDCLAIELPSDPSKRIIHMLCYRGFNNYALIDVDTSSNRFGVVLNEFRLMDKVTMNFIRQEVFGKDLDRVIVYLGPPKEAP